MMPDWTPTQARMLKVLSDGMPHRYEELRACLDDELARNVKTHIGHIRKKLRPIGQDIVCEYRGRLGAMILSGYRHVILISTATE